MTTETPGTTSTKKIVLYLTIDIRSCVDLFSALISLRTYSSKMCNASFELQILKKEMAADSSFTFSKIRITWSFHVVILRGDLRSVQRFITQVHSQCPANSVNLLSYGVFCAVCRRRLLKVPRDCYGSK